MNPKIEKLRTERSKNEAKIATLQARNKEIDGQITALENTDIIGLVRASGMTPEQLADFMRTMREEPAQAVQEQNEYAKEFSE
ncbi:MAG: DUF4315 family protein [Lachnospiraceae bacterium]|nr:DUF4315 family protein [Bacillota bacterium]MCD7841696.1 DUF4315 family protein [Lachnospiraceae bacterium]